MKQTEKFTIPEMILFDSGGTLCIDLDYDMRRATGAILPYVAANGGQIGAETLYRSMRGVFDDIRAAREADVEVSQFTITRLACAKLGAELTLDAASFERIFRHALTPVEITPRVDELVSCLNAAGVRTGVISNSKFSGGSLKERLCRLLPENRFEFFISSCDYAVCKPKSALFEVGLAAAGLPAGSVWYCGDSYENDVIGARRAGIFPVLYDPMEEEDAAKDRAFGLEKDDEGAYLRISDWWDLVALLKAAREKGNA